MVKVDSSLWMILNVAGIFLLAAGALTIMFVSPPKPSVSMVYIAVGITLIVATALLVGVEGYKLRKEDEEFRRFEEIRDEARMVPNDLRDGYLIDYTAANTKKAISYTDNETETCNDAEYFDDHSDDDVVIIYSD